MKVPFTAITLHLPHRRKDTMREAPEDVPEQPEPVEAPQPEPDEDEDDDS